MCYRASVHNSRMADGASLLALPQEVFLLICRLLSTGSLSALELSSASLHLKVQNGGAWGDKARAANKAKAFGFTTKLMDYTKENNVKDQSVFKVILGARKIIRATCRHYMEAFACNPYRDKLYNVFGLQHSTVLYCSVAGRVDGRFRDIIGKIVARKRSVIKEWGKEEENSINVFKEYFAEEEVNVAAILEKMEGEAVRMFAFRLEEAAAMVKDLC